MFSFFSIDRDKRVEAKIISAIDDLRLFGWLSPKVAIRSFSMISAGTSIETHHRFMREAEELRFKFVRSLNQAHIEQLSYIDDINRNKGGEEWKKLASARRTGK